MSTEGTLRHFKVPYDPNFDWEAAAVKVFHASQKYLVMAEKLETNGHVHFQGYFQFGDSLFEKNQAEAFKTHYYKTDARISKNKHLIRNVKREVTETGFQYMVKEAEWERHILASNGWTLEDLQALHDQSEHHVRDLKRKLRDHLHAIDTSEDSPERMHKKYKMAAINYYIEEEKQVPPGFQRMILNYMLMKKPVTEERKEYCMELFK